MPQISFIQALTSFSLIERIAEHSTASLFHDGNLFPVFGPNSPFKT